MSHGRPHTSYQSVIVLKVADSGRNYDHKYLPSYVAIELKCIQMCTKKVHCSVRTSHHGYLDNAKQLKVYGKVASNEPLSKFYVQESWCNWKTTERLIRLRKLRNLNTETSSDSSHLVICFSSHLAIKSHIHKRCHLMN